MRDHLHTTATTIFLLGAALAAMHGYAAESSISAARSDELCSADLTIDKEKLAAYLLRKYPVGAAYLSVGANPAPLTSNKALLHWLLVKRAATRGAATCDGSDACNVDRIAADMQRMLNGEDSRLKPSGKTDPVLFFDTPDASSAVHCASADAAPDLFRQPETVQAAAAPVASPASPASPAPSASPAVLDWTDKLRIRGNPDQLSIDKNDSGGYASVDKAQIDFADDSVAGVKTRNAIAYAGYSLAKPLLGDDGSSYEAVPYVGFQQNRASMDGTGTFVTTTRTSDIGMLSNFHFAYAGTADTEDFTARPDYLIDSVNGSRLLTANFTYTVIRKGWLNDLIKTSLGMSVKPILIGESRNGIYINRGDASVADGNQDFLRAGAQAGFAAVSNNPAIPVDFLATYTGLAAIKGSRGIHYVKAGLTYNFNRHVGLSLDYSNGLLPDTAEPEKKWNLGVTSKF